MMYLRVAARRELLALQLNRQVICCMCSTVVRNPSLEPVAKKAQKKKKKPCTIDSVELKESDIVESFIKGRGPGGQSINKSASRVRLTHIPSGIAVAVQETRDLSSNRKIARKLLKEKLDFMLNGAESKLGLRISKKQKKKSKSASRTAKKYDKSKEPTATPGKKEEGSESSSSDSGSSSSDSDNDDKEDNLK